MQAWVFLFLCVGVLAQQNIELTKLYTATNGESWTNNTNWLHGDDPCNWFGVGCQSGIVVELDLTDNNMTGTLPTSLALPTLSKLRLGFNLLLSGDIPNYSNMNLTEIYLNNTGLTGNFPAWFSSLPYLETLSLSGASLEGSFPTEWCKMPKILKLSLGSQNLTGGLPDCIGEMKTIVSLEIVDAALGGVVPSSISNLQSLEILTLVDTDVSGVLPETMSGLANIAELRLKGNSLQGTFPASIQSMSNLVYLSIESNYFSGPIPEWLGTMSNLLYIDIRCNNFIGPVPEWLQEQPSPNVLFACNNITDLPSWCFQDSHCGDKGCEGTRCSPQPTPDNDQPNKAVIVVLACFLGLLLIGNSMLVVFLIRRKCMRYDHTAELKPILSPRNLRRNTSKEKEENFH